MPCVIAIGITAVLCIALFFGVEPVERLLAQITVVPAEFASAPQGGVDGP